MVENGDVKLIKKEKDVISDTAGIWNIEDDGVEFERKLREESEKRRERELE